MFATASTIALAFVATIWSQDGVVNIAFKLVFILLALMGAVEAAKFWGVI